MAAPNIATATSHYAKSVDIALSDTNMTVLVSNAASSGKLLRVSSIVVTNVDGTSAADITVKRFSEDDIGGTGRAIGASTYPVPADSSIVVVDSSIAMNLEEDRSIGCQASAGGDLEVACNYEEIS